MWFDVCGVISCSSAANYVTLRACTRSTAGKSLAVKGVYERRTRIIRCSTIEEIEAQKSLIEKSVKEKMEKTIEFARSNFHSVRTARANHSIIDRVEDFATKKIKEHVDSIRPMLGSMEDGEISISAYDTAWVALVEDIEGSGGPQFPSSLQWIANNQLQDGSWGDSSIFEAHDRIINTLACVIALKSWNVHPLKSKKGAKEGEGPSRQPQT